MTLLNPLYLWALLGLAVPIVIHFWSNKSGRTIKVGSTQFLKETESSQSRSIRLNELFLLLLRLFALTLLVFILTEPSWKRTVKHSALTYVVEPALLEQQDIQVLLDSLAESVDVRLLSEGFPPYEEVDEDRLNDTPDYWQLAQQFATLQTDSVVVMSTGMIKGLKGARPTTTTPTTWMVLDVNDAQNRPVMAYKSDNTFEIVNANASTEQLQLERLTLAENNAQLRSHSSADSLIVMANSDQLTIPLFPKTEKKVMVVDDGSTSNPSQIMINALNAIENVTDYPIAVEVLESYVDPSEPLDLLIWNSMQAPPQLKAPQLVFKPDPYANQIIEKSELAPIWHLTAPLNSENSIESHFTEHLLQLLEIREEASAAVAALDQRQVQAKVIAPHYQFEEAKNKLPGEFIITKWLWILFIPVLILERMVSKFRKQ